MDLPIFSRKIATIETIEESLASSAVFSEVIFCVIPFKFLLINFIPVHNLLILLHVKWLFTFFLHCSFSFRTPSFSHFCTNLYSSLPVFWNASSFLFMLLLILLVIQVYLFIYSFIYFIGEYFYSSLWNCRFYTDFNISTHWFS